MRCPVLVTFESDWRAARNLITTAVRTHAPDVEKSGATIRRQARSYHIKLGALTPIVYMTVRDSGVLLTARFLVVPQARRSTEEAIWTAILDGLGRSRRTSISPTRRHGPTSKARSSSEASSTRSRRLAG